MKTIKCTNLILKSKKSFKMLLIKIKEILLFLKKVPSTPLQEDNKMI